ncbi:MAG: ShlB/FhaC/HecB family hemolysin secretion/activation protein, partial [Vampirovibrionales bacterium]
MDVRHAITKSKYALLDTDEDAIEEEYRDTLIERDSIRDIRWGINFQKIREKDEFSTRQELTVGLPFAGASLNTNPDASNQGGGSQFFKYLAAYNYVRELPKSLALVLNAATQWSPGTLPASDVGGLGGMYLTRGYHESWFQVDQFIYGSAELRAPFFL